MWPGRFEGCLQCKRTADGTSSRLVQDACGHRKCRICLLEDETQCRQCAQQNGAPEPKSTAINCSVITTCNGVKSGAAQSTLKANQTVPNVTKKRDLKANKTSKGKDKRPYNQIQIPSHITVDLEANTYFCTICNKSFSTKGHVKYHTYCAGVKLHNCAVCQKEFILKSQLDIHMYKHSKQKPHTCNICNKSFAERSKLKRHTILHTGTKAFVCSECGKAFKTKESLKVHSIIHRGEKPFACKYCKARFNNSSNLKKHIVSHSSEKEHMCDQCGKRFKLKWALSVHQKSHQRTRDHICTICHKTFVNSKDLQRHNLVHLEAKAYTCSVCRTSFRRKDNLSRHIRNTHPGKTVEIIKNLIPPQSPPPVLIDNPNAIHVITAPPTFGKNKESRAASVINGPPKLAFKTPAFKHNYNIQRDLNDSVNICQKILSPHTAVGKEGGLSAEICQRILEPNATPLHYETSFQNRKHAMIKNIKFKVPIQYTMNAKRELYRDVVPLEPVKTINGEPSTSHNNNVYTELQNIGTSVIVNTPQSMHWRRRTSQTLNIK